MKKCISEYKQVTKKKKRSLHASVTGNRECATFWHYEVDILAAIFSQIAITIWCFVDERNKIVIQTDHKRTHKKQSDIQSNSFSAGQ